MLRKDGLFLENYKHDVEFLITGYLLNFSYYFFYLVGLDRLIKIYKL